MVPSTLHFDIDIKKSWTSALVYVSIYIYIYIRCAGVKSRSVFAGQITKISLLL